MADIFISYTRGDAARAGELATALEQRGFTVFWDTEVLPGQLWRDVIHDELVQASCVIVAWSEGSTRSRWVVEEASEALEAGKLLPVLLDGSLPPFGFRGVEAADLSDWTPGSPSREFDNLADAVRRIVGEAPTDDDIGDASPAQPTADDEAPVVAAAPAPDEVPATTALPIVAAIDEEAAEPAPEPEAADTPELPSEVVATTVEEEPAPDPLDERPGSLPEPPEEPVQAARVVDEPEQSPPLAPVSEPAPPARTDDVGSRESDEAERPEGIIARLGTMGTVGIGVAAVLVILLGIVIASGGDDDPPTSTLADGDTPIGEVSPPGDTVTVTNVLESDTVMAFRAATAPVIDGDLGDWEAVPEAYRLRTEVFRDPGVGTRLGDDSPGVVLARYDDSALYLAVVSDDDIYSQQNTGNQIWRGDALNINLTTASPEAISERPDGDDFQLTMTPRAADGRPSHVWFTGNGSGFDDNTTELPVVLAGAVGGDGSWQLEAAIPWSVFGLSGPPSGDLQALLAVFDNDGEVVDGRPRQTVILGHTPAEFQRPLTWGTVTFER